VPALYFHKDDKQTKALSKKLDSKNDLTQITLNLVSPFYIPRMRVRHVRLGLIVEKRV
jgi:hypothetical protein